MPAQTSTKRHAQGRPTTPAQSNSITERSKMQKLVTGSTDAQVQQHVQLNCLPNSLSSSAIRQTTSASKHPREAASDAVEREQNCEPKKRKLATGSATAQAQQHDQPNCPPKRISSSAIEVTITADKHPHEATSDVAEQEPDSAKTSLGDTVQVENVIRHELEISSKVDDVNALPSGTIPSEPIDTPVTDKSTNSEENRSPAGSVQIPMYTIQYLNPMLKSPWSFVGTILARNATRSRRDFDHEGKMFEIYLADVSGSQIRAAIFDDGVDKSDKILTPGATCLFSGGRIKYVDPKVYSWSEKMSDHLWSQR